jgi:hypothetical protein
VINTLRRVRRRFLPAHIRADIRDTELLVALLEDVLEPASDCLDVGAHAGSVLAEMVRMAPEGRHVAWEPLPEFAARLREAHPGVEVREAALSILVTTVLPDPPIRWVGQDCRQGAPLFHRRSSPWNSARA